MTAVALGPGLASPEALLRRLIDDRFASRLFAKDVGLWGKQPAPRPRNGSVGSMPSRAEMNSAPN